LYVHGIVNCRVERYLPHFKIINNDWYTWYWFLMMFPWGVSLWMSFRSIISILCYYLKEENHIRTSSWLVVFLLLWSIRRSERLTTIEGRITGVTMFLITLLSINWRIGQKKKSVSVIMSNFLEKEIKKKGNGQDWC